MEFAVNEEEKKVKFSIGEKEEEVSRKFALQFATKVIDVLTGGKKRKMIEIMQDG